MRILFRVIAVLAGMLGMGMASAAEVTVQSGPARMNLLELFTSEGCSSCPPAESWFSTLRQSPLLWKEIVPVSFHVDYWDNLGWKDSFASKAYTKRQSDYVAAWGAQSMYTPGFVLNGREWRASDLDAITAGKRETGSLAATINEKGDVRMTFQPVSKSAGKWQAHAVLLGLGASSEVRAGENRGRTLIHDFVVLAFQEAEMKGEPATAVLHLPASEIKSGTSAFAVWVTETGKLEPMQAAGGNL